MDNLKIKLVVNTVTIIQHFVVLNIIPDITVYITTINVITVYF